MPLGIFDSGLGGLTVVRHLREQLPSEDLVFFADQAHVPYGDKSTEELRSYLESNVVYLQSQGVDAIVMGCNTSCAVASQFGYPRSSVPILDLIEAAAQAVAQSGARRIGVIATAATVRMGAYSAAIARHAPSATVQEVAAPALVPLVEAGHRSGPLARAAVAQACSMFAGPLDALVLACTHYPLLDGEFAAVLGNSTLRIDPSIAQAERAVAFVRARTTKAQTGTGRTRYVTSGDLRAFRTNLREIVGPSDDVEQAEEDVHRDEAERRPGDDLQRSVSFEIHS
jgi:glutamate racemase